MKRRRILGTLLLVIILLCGCSSSAANEAAPAETQSEGTDEAAPAETQSEAADMTLSGASGSDATSASAWSPESLKTGLTTVIEYDKRYDAVVSSPEDAIEVVRLYGGKQKKNYENPAVSAIEKKLEEEFGLAYAALGEMDEETAQDVYTAFQYMYETYPELQGTLTDITLGNFTWNGMAQTRTHEFITNGNNAPIVLKREIILSAASFLKRDNLLKDCRYNEETGFWPKNSTVSMIIVHELGHHLLDVHNAKKYGFEGNYVTDENMDAYRNFAQEGLAWNQEEIQRILADAYAEWSKTNEGTEEDFRASISEYARGVQDDGGISYTETFAEAVADLYANGEDAALASKLIVPQGR